MQTLHSRITGSIAVTCLPTPITPQLAQDRPDCHQWWFAACITHTVWLVVFNAPLVYCGDPRPLPAHWCDVILSPLPTQQTRSIKTDLLLTGISPSDIIGKGETLRNTFKQTGAPCTAALLIGGDSRSHHYEDWQALISGVRNQLGSQGWRWLITTSRHTPQQVERQLQLALRPEFLVDTVWWHQQASPMVQAYLGTADLVLVTRDSMSMLSEAISANKPTLALAPNCVHRSEFIDAIVNTQVEQKRLREKCPCPCWRPNPSRTFFLCRRKPLHRKSMQPRCLIS